LKCHPILEFGIVVNQLNDEDYGLDNFEMIIETNELAKELVYKELQVFWRYQINGKSIKYLLER
jgi:hypothetical protein